MIAFGIFVQAGSVGLQQRSHLVDKRSGTAGANTVHALFHVSVFEINDLGVFSAQFNRYIRLWSEFLEGGGDGNDLLYKRNFQMIGERQAAGTGYDGVEFDAAQLIICFLQKTGQRLPYICIMPLIIGK